MVRTPSASPRLPHAHTHARAQPPSPRIRRRIRLVLGYVFAFGGIFYVEYHLSLGPNGVIVRQNLERKTQRLEAKVDALETRKAELEHRVALVSDGSLDPDLLEQLALQSLGWGADDDLLIILPSPTRSTSRP